MARSAEELYEGSEQDEGASAPESHDAAAQSGGETSQDDLQQQAQQPTETVAQLPDDGNPEDLAGLKRALAASRDDTKAQKKARREVEQQLAELRGRLSVLEGAGRDKPKPPGPEDIENRFFETPGQVLHGLEQGTVERINQAKMELRADVSEMFAMQRHEDYVEAKRAWLKAANGNQPWLWQEFFASGDPAEDVVYVKGKQLLGGGSDSSPEVERLKAENEELRSQVSGQQSVQRTRLTIPKSNAGARGSGVGSQGVWSGPRTAEQIYGE